MLVVGLGNPGGDYRRTRHNLGFEVIDFVITRTNIESRKKRRYLSLITEGVIKDKKVILAKPQTYMNRSGVAVRLLVDGYGAGLDDLLIIYDDVNLPLGQLRIRKTGSAGGHKGVSSIIASLGTSEFGRLRIGIGTPGEGVEVSDYVLSPFEEDEKELIGKAIETAGQAVEEIVISGIDAAMNKYDLKEICHEDPKARRTIHCKL